jgi:hypothetical protein
MRDEAKSQQEDLGTLLHSVLEEFVDFSVERCALRRKSQ